MRIINCMFGRNLGGIEQSFVDYGSALQLSNNKVLAIVHPKAKIIPKLEASKSTSSTETQASLKIAKVANFGQGDIFAIFKLRKLIKRFKPDAIICHGNRSISIMRRAARGLAPVIGVAHNYNIKRLAKTDGAFTITDDLRKKVIKLGQPEDKVFQIPNMIKLASTKPIYKRNSPLTIGAMGRFVHKKGFITFIEAIKEVHQAHPEVKVILAGDGEEAEALKSLTEEFDLSEVITFSGWVKNPDDFFSQIDIFCLPSLHEPFGIVLLEAFARLKPVVTTASEGPSEIATHNQDALLVPIENTHELANALIELIEKDELSEKLAKNGYENMQKNYILEVVADKIQTALESII